MKLQKPYLVDGEVFYLDDEQAETARQQATDAGATFEDAQTVSLDGNDFTVPVSQYDAVLAQAQEAGSVAQPRTFVQMDDGERLALNGNDVASMVNRRRYGYGISRNDFKKLGIPDWYARGEGDRMALTDQLGDLVAPEDPELRATRIKQLVEGYGGNIDHNGRPMLLNADENGRITGYSTTSSTVVQDDDGKFVVVPTVVTDADGNAVRLDTQEEALAQYKKTGEFYGKFGSEARAADAANNIHSMHQDLYKGKWNDLIHENWDAMSDEIRNNPGTAEEHQRRLQRATTEKPGGALDYMKTAKEAEYGRELSPAEAAATYLPVVGSVMDANEKRIESVEKRLYEGDFRDSLEASRLALSIGIPQEIVKRVNAESNGDGEAMRKGFAELVSKNLKDRILMRHEKGDKLNEFDLNFLQKAGVGAANLGKTVVEMANPVVAAATMGASTMNNAGALVNSDEWGVDENGNPVKAISGEDKDTAMLKGLASAAAERAIWMNKLPGSRKLMQKAGTSFVKRNAVQLADMAVKNDLTDFVDNVMGMQVPDGEKKKKILDWAAEHFLPHNMLMDMLEAAPAHFGLKAVRLLTPGGRAEYQANLEAKRQNEVEEAVKRGMKRGKAEAEAEARYNRTMDAETAYNLDADINTLVETGTIPEAARETVKKRVIENAGDNLRSLEGADAREEAVITAADQITGEKNARRDADAANKEVYKRQKAEMEEYQAQEEVRKAREAAAEAEPTAPEAPKAEVPSADEPQFPTRENRLTFSPEYAEWLKKSGRNDTDKNWNRFIAENELPDAWKARNEEKDARIEQQRQQADDAATEAELRRGEEMRRKAEEERVRREEEAKVAAEQAAYDEKMAKREEARANETPSPESQMEMANEAEGKRRLMTKEEADAYREGQERAAEEAEADVSLEQNERLRAEFETAKDRDAFASKHAAWMKENGIPEYGEFLERNGIQPSKVAKLAYDRAVARAMGVEVPPLTPAESAEIKSDLDRRVAEWQARKDAAKAKGDPFKEPKPTAQQMEFDFGKPSVAQNAPKTPQEASASEPVRPTETLAETPAETPVATKDAKATEAQPTEPTRVSAAEAGAEFGKKHGFDPNLPTQKSAKSEIRLEIDDTAPAQKLADPDFQAWATKNGRTATDGARRDYDAQQVDALGKHITKNFIRGVKFRRVENAAEVPDAARMLYSKDGNVVGWYDRAKKEVVTLPGATASTVAHEIGWHAAYDHAENLARHGDARLLNALRRYADDARRIVVDPATGRTLEDHINARYGQNGVSDPAVLLEEIGAARYTMDNIAKIKDAAARRQAAKWYGRAWNAVADTYKSILTKMGINKVNLDAVTAMTPDQLVSTLADQMLKGKSLGKAAKPTAIDMNANEGLVKLHDRKLKDHLRPVEEIEREAGKTVSGSAHTMLRLLPGKVQAAINEAEAFGKRVTADCEKAGIKISELNEFMYAQGAGERNAKVLRNTGRLDGSAMSHADIQRTLDAYRNSPKYAELQRIADEVLAFQKRGFEARVRAGLIDRQTAADLIADEPHHVPMKSRFDADGNHTGFDASATFGRPEFKEAKGRKNLGDGPLEWILQEYVDAKSRSSENTARRAFLSTVLTHPEIGTVRKLNPGETAGEIRRKGQPGDPNVVTVKANGDTYVIKLNGTRGELIARAMTGRGLVRPPEALQNAMRWWSSTATAWSPTFAGRNFLADMLDVFAVNLAEHGIVKGTGKSAQHVFNALTLIPEIRKYVKTGETNNALLREAVDAGVLMGGGARSAAFDRGEEALKTLSRDWKNGKSRARSVGRALFGWVDTLNQTSELMNRMADYKLQRAAGKSKNEAALHAREITVDFNEKGEWTPVTNLANMFSNSSLGATMRLNKALFTGKNGAQLAAGAFALGLAEGAFEVFNNGDDEEGRNLNEHTRSNSIYIRNGKDVYRIPLHSSPVSIIKYAGNVAARKMLGAKSTDEASDQLASEMIGILTQFAGLGDIGDNAIAGVFPSVIQPVIQGLMNSDFANRPIENVPFAKEKPKSHNGRYHTPNMYKVAVQYINRKTGGNEARKGRIDISPEALKHAVESVGKNELRDILNVIEVVNCTFGSGEWDRRNIPVVRDYYRTTGGNDNRYFKAKESFDADRYELMKSETMTKEDRVKYVEAHPWLKSSGSVLKMVQAVDSLRNLERGKVKSGRGWTARKTPPTEEQVAEWQKRREAIQQKLIDLMDRK